MAQTNPTSRPALREPGIWSMRPGHERYRVPAQGAVVIDLRRGDTLTLTDAEGGQAGEVIAFNTDGRTEPGMLDAKGTVRDLPAVG